MSAAAEAAVRSFYRDLWEGGDLSRIAALMHEDVTFHGTLGQKMSGHAAFEDYVRGVRGALSGYTCEIKDLVAAGDHAAARVRFSGLHDQGPLLDVPATNRHIAWDGAAFFTFEGARIRDLWVIGDMLGLLSRLRA
jgi:predicted ester cyclase